MMNEAFEEDTHICLKCQMTIEGLDNYVLHRRNKCNSVLVPPALNLESATRLAEGKIIRTSPDNSPTKAQDFFSSLELRSSSKNRLDDFEIDFDLKPNLDMPSTSSSKYNFARELDLDSNFVEHIELDLAKSTRKTNFESLDLEHDNLISDTSLMVIDNKRSSILDSDIFSSSSIDGVLTSAIEPPTYLVPPPSHTSGKWMPGKSGHRKYGSDIHYFCRTCNRRLSSRLLYEKHLHSELHFKRKAESSVYDMEDAPEPSRKKRVNAGTRINSRQLIDAFSIPICNPASQAIAQVNGQDNVAQGKSRVDRTKVVRQTVQPRRLRLQLCRVCNVRVSPHLMGKHLLSHFHYTRAYSKPVIARDLILNNMGRIVKHAPFQCALCSYYCNSNHALTRHWRSDMHLTSDKKYAGMYWCQQCKVETEDCDSMAHHLYSDDHIQVAATLNHTVPMIVRKRTSVSCSYCSKTFALKIQLVQHIKTYHGLQVKPEPTYSCSQCSFSCAKRRALQRHELIKHAPNSNCTYFCGACDATFSSRAQCKEHRRLLTCRLKAATLRGRDVRRRCNMCGEQCQDLAALKIHLFSNHAGALHRCETCGLEFAISQDLSRHVREAKCKSKSGGLRGEKNKFYCDHCGQTFSRRSNLATHSLKLHAPPNVPEADIQLVMPPPRRPRTNNFECALCGFRAARKPFLQRHMLSMHFPKSRTRDWLCKSCGKAFFDKYAMRQHEKLHRPKEHRCSEAGCMFSCRYQSELNRHVAAVHSEDRNYACHFCSYHAKTKFQLKKHICLHMGQKSFKCTASGCSMSFTVYSHLRRHMRLHTGSKPYHCPYCDYVCNTLENLRKHILETKKHPGKKMYLCKICKDAGVTEVFGTNAINEFRAHLHLDHPTLNLGGTKNVLAHVVGICENFLEIAEMENYRMSRRQITTRRSSFPKTMETSSSLNGETSDNETVQAIKTEFEFNISKFIKRTINFPCEIIPPGLTVDTNCTFPVIVNINSDDIINFESNNCDYKRSINVPMVEITPDYQLQLDVGENGTPCVVFVPYNGVEEDEQVLTSICDTDNFISVVYKEDSNSTSSQVHLDDGFLLQEAL